jgi:hypothetical protein
MPDLTLPASIPGMKEAAVAVLGFDPWDLPFAMGDVLDGWHSGPSSGTVPHVDLSLPAGRLVALEWLMTRGVAPMPWVNWCTRVLCPGDGEPEAMHAEVLRIARAEGWDDAQ